MPSPALRALSLGAGVQSTTLLLLSAAGVIPRFDVAIFADTGWEPAAVYAHLDRLDGLVGREIPIRRVSAGDIRRDALDPDHHFVSMPLFALGPDGERGMARRQCTREYKIAPIKAAVRALLGYPHPRRVPKGIYAEQAIGISVDEFHRAKDADVGYLRNVFPLLSIGWTRVDCRAYLTTQGLADTPRSACVGCPFHRDAEWRRLRDTDPAGWAQAVAFDEAIRHGYPKAGSRGMELRGTYYLHHSRRPLTEADLNVPDGPDRSGGSGGQDQDAPSCSPWSCRGEESPAAGTPS
ncbi:hypothetical protein DP939_42200 [Spongiactinospora rosea]|uniref:Phosphoadenosine phosphosulfate reductase n=1 Tax=Spongiactinospora rosea TaxID=2248750 RepID=A0A366LJW7_9ACTN|nr:hypothetical protein DP939_42200 [Spongiactinospora rosea]